MDLSLKIKNAFELPPPKVTLPVGGFTKSNWTSFDAHRFTNLPMHAEISLQIMNKIRKCFVITVQQGGYLTSLCKFNDVSFTNQYTNSCDWIFHGNPKNKLTCHIFNIKRKEYLVKKNNKYQLLNVGDDFQIYQSKLDPITSVYITSFFFIFFFIF